MCWHRAGIEGQAQPVHPGDACCHCLVKSCPFGFEEMVQGEWWGSTYHAALNVLQSKGGEFSRRCVRKSLERIGSCSPVCVRQCRRRSVPWALSRRYHQVPSAGSPPGTGPAEPAPPLGLSRSWWHRAAIGCDCPHSMSSLAHRPREHSRACNTMISPSLRLAECRDTLRSLPCLGRWWR